MYTNDAAVLGIAATVLFFASLFQLADATQCIASYALRGYKVTKMPMFIHAAAFWGCGLLPGYLLKLNPCNPSNTKPTSPLTTLSVFAPKPKPLSRSNMPMNCATSSGCPSSTEILFYGSVAAAISF
ncbi:Na(+)/drug antiporter [Mycobacteroides abscessus subsp. massiliense]|nr:Na(+)/drug antiporter [Mycobacteroides abscessus subsp. massiliense]